MYLLLLGVLRVQRLSPERLAQSRTRNAFSTFKRRCRKDQISYADLIDAFKEYLNDRCGLSIGTLTANDAERILRDQGVNAETTKSMYLLIQRFETAVYAGNNLKDTDGHRPSAGSCQKNRKGYFMIRQVRLISSAILVLVCFLNMAQASTGPSFVEQFFEANQAYKNHQFQQAIDGYLHLIENGPENGQVYYNLGNAYFRRGRPGKGHPIL